MAVASRPYGNWTDEGWNVRVHGNVYKIPNVSQSRIDRLANFFLVGKDVEDLDDEGKALARNITRSIFVLQQENEEVIVNFAPDTHGGAQGGAQSAKLPYNTTAQGDFDVFLPLKNTTGSDGGHLLPGNETSEIQTLQVYANGTDSGNATAYLLPTTGVTIVSDIDDVLRVTKIYDPKEGLLNTFANPFTPWLNMPDVYANWSASMPTAHFHYLTTTPEQISRKYIDFVYKTYPLGSFDMRPLNFSDLSATLSIRRFLLDKIFETFPARKFVLVGDTSNPDVMRDYPALFHGHPGQVLCILLRNTSATDPSNHIPYNTKGFQGMPQPSYMIFTVPDDLSHLDIANGQCYNKTIRQNITFGEQGLPFGIGEFSGGPASVVLAPKYITVFCVAGLSVLMYLL